MLERLFTSKTRIKVLGLLIFNSDKDYHLREISRLINISPTYVAKELDNLSKLNLVSKARKANLSIYSINKGCILLNDLRRILLKTDYKGVLKNEPSQ